MINTNFEESPIHLNSSYLQSSNKHRKIHTVFSPIKALSVNKIFEIVGWMFIEEERSFRKSSLHLPRKSIFLRVKTSPQSNKYVFSQYL